MQKVLIPLHGGSVIPLDKAIVFFGRGSECDIILTDSRKVSRKHCCIAQIDKRIVIRDLGSMNGLRINDTVVKDEGNLDVGDVIWVGDLGFRLDLAAAVNQKSSSIIKKVPLPANKKRSKPTIDPALLSQDYPVAVPDEDDAADATISKNSRFIPEDEIVDLADLED